MNFTASGKDATDFPLIAQRHAEAGNEDSLYGAGVEVLAKAEYGMDLAGAKLLGIDAASTCNAATRGSRKFSPMRSFSN